MNQIITDWQNFCGGIQYFEKYHFSQLFFYGINQSEIVEIFKNFENSEELIFRLNQYLSLNEVNNSKCLIKRGEIEELVKLDVENKFNLIKLLNHNFKYFEWDVDINKIREIENKGINSIFNDEVFNCFLNSFRKDEEKNYYLIEALYGLTFSYNELLYIIQPITTIQIDLSNYYKLLEKNIQYAFDESTIYIGSNL